MTFRPTGYRVKHQMIVGGLKTPVDTHLQLLRNLICLMLAISFVKIPPIVHVQWLVWQAALRQCPRATQQKQFVIPADVRCDERRLSEVTAFFRV